jgi:hypothetical protein
MTNWQEEFDKLPIFSAPVPQDINGVHTFVVDISVVKAFIAKTVEEAKREAMSEIYTDLIHQSSKNSGHIYEGYGYAAAYLSAKYPVKFLNPTK